MEETEGNPCSRYSCLPPVPRFQTGDCQRRRRSSDKAGRRVIDTHTHTLIRPHIHTLYKSHHAWCTETWARHCTDRRKEGWGEGGRAGRGVGEGRGGPVWWVPVTGQVLSSSDLICLGLHRCSALVCSSLSWPTTFILICSSIP